MKRMIFFLLGVISSIQAMENETAVRRCVTPAVSLVCCSSLTDFFDEIKIKFLEYAADDSSVETRIRNVYSLASTCKDFFRLFNDDKFVNYLLRSIESRRQNKPITLLKKDAYYDLCLKAIAMKLRTAMAVEWYYNQSRTKGTLKDFKRVSSCERMDFRTIMKTYYGGFNVSEYRIVDARPVKVLEYPESFVHRKERIPVKVLSLKSCYLKDLGGLLYVQDLRTVQVFDVSVNELTQLDPNSFDRFDNLMNLDLSRNNLQSINLTIFAKLKRLKLLDLFQNKIKTVLCDERQDEPDFDKIDLSSNEITYIDPAVLEKISAHVIDLKNNPITNIQTVRELSKAVTKRILVDDD